MFTTPSIVRFGLILSVVWLACCGAFHQAQGQEKLTETKWKYVFRKPADGWQQPDFNDRSWREGFGGFGTQGTPGARIGTVWSTNQIWLRKKLELTKVPAKPALYLHHDENVQVYLNGKRSSLWKASRRNMK